MITNNCTATRARDLFPFPTRLIDRPRWVEAGADEHQLMVWQTVALGDDHPVLEPVRRHIEQRRLVLADEMQELSPVFRFGRVRVRWFVDQSALADGLLEIGTGN